MARLSRAEIKDKAQRQLLGMVADGIFMATEQNEEARKRGEEPDYDQEILNEAIRQAARVARSFGFVTFGGIMVDGVAVDFEGIPLEKGR